MPRNCSITPTRAPADIRDASHRHRSDANPEGLADPTAGRWCRGRRIREVDDQVWQVSFLQYDLGYFARDQDRVEPGPNPFSPDTVLTMCPYMDPSPLC